MSDSDPQWLAKTAAGALAFILVCLRRLLRAILFAQGQLFEWPS